MSRKLGCNEKGDLEVIHHLNNQEPDIDGAKPGRGRPTVILENCVMEPVRAKLRITEKMYPLVGNIVQEKDKSQPRAPL